MSSNPDRLPPQTKYIVGNEACERLSYYGVVAVLTTYAAMLFGDVTGASVAEKDAAKQSAKEVVHWWKFATYFLPLVGAFIADRYWGRYRTILWISFAYCMGHGLMSATEGTKWGLFAGLALLAIGSGGIKPCVSAFVGDQFKPGQERQMATVYGLFYWSINFGSFFSFSVIPVLKDNYGYAAAFGVPGVFMLLATYIFWKGRTHYVMKPPSATLAPVDAVTRTADRRTLMAIGAIFAPVIVFWSVFDQQHTTWVQQGDQMVTGSIGNYKVTGERMQSVNPLFVMALIPIFTLWLYPAIERAGLKPTPLRRMGAGMVVAGCAFAISGLLQQQIEAGARLSIWWQLIPYGVMTAAEVLISTTGLEFAFTVAPQRLKSTIMSFWLLTVAFGNMLAAQITSMNKTTDAAGNVARRLSESQEMFLYVGLVLVVAVIFVAIAAKFPDRSPKPGE
jgi:proton-dependent oligopeptide transporter, POT family